MRFWDSSGIVALLVEEPATEAARRLFAEDGDAVVWGQTPLEVLAALWRRRRRGQLDEAGRAAAERSKGYAWRDYYATYYEAPNDPTHLHEATHQIFRNRLRLPGGGSWFQEGVAEYVSSNANERRSIAKRLAKDGKFIPFRTFVGLRQLIDNPHLDALASYLQAASLIDFLRNGKFRPENFRRFLDEVGGLPRGKVDRIEEAIRSVYGVDLEGLEKAWVEHWKKS